MDIRGSVLACACKAACLRRLIYIYMTDSASSVRVCLCVTLQVLMPPSSWRYLVSRLWPRTAVLAGTGPGGNGGQPVGCRHSSSTSICGCAAARSLSSSLMSSLDLLHCWGVGVLPAKQKGLVWPVTGLGFVPGLWFAWVSFTVVGDRPSVAT